MATIRFQANQTEMNVLSLLKQLNDSDDSCQKYYLIRERLEDIQLRWGTLDDILSDGLWEKGRIFNHNLEIRWEKQWENYDVLVFSENALPEALENLPQAWRPDDISTKPVNLFLLGRYKEQLGKFIEVRIPRMLEYQSGATFAENQEAIIVAEEYSLYGVVKHTRFKEVKPYEQENN